MTREEQLHAAVKEAYRNGLDGYAEEMAAMSNEELAGDMIAYDDDISQFWDGTNITGLINLTNEIADILPAIRKESLS